MNLDVEAVERPPAPWQCPGTPATESARLAALRRYDILDTDPELAFDDVTLLAAQICGTPIALISFVDEHRQWFKSRIGVQAQETARDISFCTHTIGRPDELLMVRDASADPRFSGSPLVCMEPRIRFYAGAALVTPEGHPLGALCVKDTVPRELDPGQQQALKALSRQVITLLELRRSQRERRHLYERQRLVLETLTSAIVMVDDNDRIALVNQAAERMFGLPRTELIGSLYERIVPERLHARSALRRQALRAGGEEGPQPLESRMLRSDGVELATETSATCFVIGTEGFVLYAISDVSQRKHMEARLREVQTLHRAIVDNAGCAIISTSTEGTITSFNPAAERMLGYAADEVVGLRMPDFFHEVAPADAAILPGDASAPGVSAYAELVGGDLPFGRRERTCQRKDGGQVPVLLSVTELRHPNGRHSGYLGLALDITERKRAEDLLRAKNEDLKTFAYTVSHDLKAPLRGILGYAQELQLRHRDGLNDRACHCLSQIMAATRNLDELIEDLLEYSRCASAKPRFDDVIVLDVVERILRDRNHAIRERDVVVDVRVPAIALRTWERGLHEVLGNLIDNALKYSRGAQPPRLTITAEQGDGRCVIRITDNGIGFDMKYHDRIFGLFNRLVRSSDYEGTGAGLAIVARLAGKFDARVHAESAPGEGATFVVELPLVRADVETVR